MTSVPHTILVVDDDAASLGALLECLRRAAFRVLVAQDGRSALERAEYGKPDLILLDVMMPDMNGFETCKLLKSNPATAEAPVLFLTALADTREKIQGFEAGAVDYLTKPFQWEEVLARVRTHLRLRECERELTATNRTLEARVEERTGELRTAVAELEALKQRLQAENVYLKQELGADARSLVGSSPALRRVLDNVARVATTDATVLIIGETGTGKELIANAVHEASPRRERPMVKLNCAAISAGLVESELFGHVKGAFTGATDKHVGRFQLADGGTLFLDEVSELPLDTQVKLLRVLQEREFEPVGSAKTQRVDVRVIAATNRQLEDEVAAGRFRSDLFYRLNVFPVEVPALRARREDIPALVDHFIERFARKFGRRMAGCAPGVRDTLVAYDWPGNVRELQNVIERAMISSPGDKLTIDWELRGHARAGAAVATRNGGVAPAAPSPVSVDAASPAAAAVNGDTLVEVERQHIIAVLKRTGGVIEGAKGAAKLLDMKPSTARYKMKRLGIRKSDYLE